MKTKTNRTVMAALLVVMALLSTTGLVLASHDTPSNVFSQGSFAALRQVEKDYQAHLAFALSETDTRRQMELNEDAVMRYTLNSTNARRLDALVAGFRARQQMELNEDAVMRHTLNRTNARRLDALVAGFRARQQMELERRATLEQTLTGNSYADWLLVEHSADFGQ